MKIAAKINELIAPTVEAMGYEYVGCEYHAQRPVILRVFIDQEDKGVTLEDCTAVSRQLGALLDVESLIDDKYRLEVSSPGVERPLFTLAHFERFIGQQAEIHLQVSLEGQQNFKGTIKAVINEEIVLVTNEREVKLSFASIGKANLISISC